LKPDSGSSRETTAPQVTANSEKENASFKPLSTNNTTTPSRRSEEKRKKTGINQFAVVPTIQAPQQQSQQEHDSRLVNSELNLDDSYFDTPTISTECETVEQITAELTDPTTMVQPATEAQKTDSISVQSDSATARVAEKKKPGIIFRAGMMRTSAWYDGKTDPSYLDRRRVEESPSLLPELSALMAIPVGSLEFRAGLGLSRWGECGEYSPYTAGPVIRSTDTWQPYSYAIVDTDSAYVYGMLFYQTTTQNINDSLLVTVTDTVFGLRPDSLLDTRPPCVRHTLITLPIECAWSFRKGNWNVGISAGLTAAWMIRSSGEYLQSDQTKLATWTKNTSAFQLGANASLEVGYWLSRRLCVLLMPSGRMAITAVEEPSGARKTYRNIGVLAGIRFQID
jgi:hypothetical protein